MWSLLMGNAESSHSSSEEGEGETAKMEGRKSGDGEEEEKRSDSPMISPSLLMKLPPIRDSEEVPLPFKVPETPLLPEKTPPAPHSTGRRSREPKFVPYEPYKAAVRPMTDTPSYLTHKKPPSSLSLSQNGSSSQNTPPSPETISDPKIRELQTKLDEADRNLKIQIQVNTEIKKLLVASVGEDLEARVDFLTQDKARLASDLRQYANRISRDFEEKEQLSVESNLWKSKFLACSLIVDDLARWKASLIQENREYEHAARVLLHEHSVLWNTLFETFEILMELNAAFDPLEGPFRGAEAISVLGLADYAFGIATKLKKRLLKDIKIADAAKRIQRPNQIHTPGEEKIDSLLSNQIDVSSINEEGVYNEMACNAVTGTARLHLQKLSDKRSSPDARKFKCCTHCQGKIQNV